MTSFNLNYFLIPNMITWRGRASVYEFEGWETTNIQVITLNSTIKKALEAANPAWMGGSWEKENQEGCWMNENAGWLGRLSES